MQMNGETTNFLLVNTEHFVFTFSKLVIIVVAFCSSIFNLCFKLMSLQLL